MFKTYFHSTVLSLIHIRTILNGKLFEKKKYFYIFIYIKEHCTFHILLVNCHQNRSKVINHHSFDLPPIISLKKNYFKVIIIICLFYNYIRSN